LTDLFTTIPWQLLEKVNALQNSDDVKILRIVRIQRLYRLIRIMRLFKLLRLFKISRMQNDEEDQQNDLRTALKKVAQLIGFCIFINHLMACAWYLVPKFMDFPENCWVNKENLGDANPGMLYLVSYYWSFQTLTQVGFGDISSHGNKVEMIVAILWMIAGTYYSSQLIANFVWSVQLLDK
jgi:hyperpolarization activated cyclic nucleotide-gated potassium channel 2